MAWKKLLLFGFILAGLFIVTGTASAAEVTTTTGGQVFLHNDNAGGINNFVYWNGEIYYIKSGFSGLGEGYYMFVAGYGEHAGNIYSITVYPTMLAVLDNNVTVTLSLTPATSIQYDGNNTLFVYKIDTAPDWADGNKIISFAVSEFDVSYSVSGDTGTLTYTIGTLTQITPEQIKTAYIPLFSSTSINGYIIPLPAGVGPYITATFVAQANDVSINYSAANGNDTTTELPVFFSVSGSVSFSVSPVALILDRGFVVITVDAYDALKPSISITPTLIVGQDTYTQSATLLQGVYTVTVTADGYDAVSFTVSADSLTEAVTTYSTLISMFPVTAIFSVSHFSAVKGYQGGLISDVIVISPRSSFTNNVTMQFINFPFPVTAIIDGTTSVVSGNNLLLGAVNGEKVITIIMSASTTTQAQAYIELIGNDAFTGTASMSFDEYIAVLKPPFSMTTPQVWVLGTNVVRIANDTNTLTMTLIVKNAGGTEIYNKIVTLTPLQIYTFSPVLDEGQNTVYISFTYLSDAGLITGTESGQILFLAEAHRQAEIDYTVMTVTYNVVNTATVKVTNPFGAVGTYTVFIVGNWSTETASKVIAILPNSTAAVAVYFSGPTNEEISAYEATIWVVYNDATVFSTTVPVTATTAPGFFGTGISQNDVIYIVIGIVAILLLVIAIRRGDEL